MTREIPFKAWLFNMADAMGIKPNSVAMRLSRKTLPYPPHRKVNSRVIYVMTDHEQKEEKRAAASGIR